MEGTSLPKMEMDKLRSSNIHLQLGGAPHRIINSSCVYSIPHLTTHHMQPFRLFGLIRPKSVRYPLLCHKIEHVQCNSAIRDAFTPTARQRSTERVQLHLHDLRVLIKFAGLINLHVHLLLMTENKMLSYGELRL